MFLNGLPSIDFPVSIFDVVLNGITTQGSIVATRLDPKESIRFATASKVKAIVKAGSWSTITWEKSGSARHPV